MKLEFVELAGFRGFRDKAKFDLAGGFTVLCGRNGTGKSTLLDAVDFAITGTINKYAVKGPRGGGLDEHIWWVGGGKAEAHYVSVGFISDSGERFVINRSRERGSDTQPQDIIERLFSKGSAQRASIETLMQTTLIRDELIASLSMDLPEQARFTAVRTAIGSMAGPDYSERTEEILGTAGTAKNRQEQRIKELQADLGRTLGELTEARSMAERSADVSEALQTIESLSVPLPLGLVDRVEAIRQVMTEKRVALQQIDGARLLSRQLLSEIEYFNSPVAKTVVEAARSEEETALREYKRADEHLKLATRLDAAEKETDEHAAHIAALLEHGSAVGLQDGHCPLCDAVRTAPEFKDAVSKQKERLAARGEKLAAASATLAEARATATTAEKDLSLKQIRSAEFRKRREELDHKLTNVREVYERFGFAAPPDDPDGAERLLFIEQENLVRLERALVILEASNAIDRVKSLEGRIASLRERNDQEAAKFAATERAVEVARQIDVSAKTVANEILTEQFDTVMPLLKELYRRLRPHSEWTEIESDFGGKVRGSLNFMVGDGHNPQFLFSSGQRRAAGLAFLLAVHLSRPWCDWRTLLLDDPIQHIDDYRALNLVEVLTAIRKAGRQVIVAVEDPALADVLCRRLRSSSGEIGRLFELHTSKTGGAQIESIHDIYPLPKLVLRQAQAS
jgi:DNA repair exonuclease SbcCD ATPase subunit